ncbi:hypothetical protein GCM10023317_33820 [Actinopolymorpha pittospori]|uniref:Uncharacterized protein n=1 Tax=Actinopolymorpha pittospori TaxID=648752 RepID=A0A927RBM1_9ACTN|nr:hypothetical protein [Actinopolymorpha pittospori]
MPRKRPARLRRVQEIAPVVRIPGVSPRVARALDRLELPELNSQEIAVAYRQWITVCQQPRRTLSREHNDWSGLIGPVARDQLERAIQALPPQLSRQLQAALTPWDQRFLEKTLPDPTRNPSGPWWWQRQGVR